MGGISRRVFFVCAVLFFGSVGIESAHAQSSSGWRASSALIGDGYACNDGGRVFVKIEGNILSVFGQGMPYPYFRVELDPDGSAKKTVGENIHPTRKIRVKVAAGTGPREIETLGEQNVCTYRIAPD